jgi:hypothetical protein
MSTRLRSIEELPGTYRTLVESVIRANLDLTRSVISRSRQPHTPSYFLRRAAIRTRVYLTTARQKVTFLFIRGPVTDNVILQLNIEFAVRAAPGVPQPSPVPPIPIYAQVPPVFAIGVTSTQAALLSAALHKAKREDMIFLRSGPSILAAVNTQSMKHARVARLDPAASQATIIFEPLNSTTFRYDPPTFVRLLDQMATWTRTGKTTGNLVPVSLPDINSPFPAQKIAAAAILGWLESRASCPAGRLNPLLGDTIPPFEIEDYRAAVVLRLKTDGTLAEKLKDDDFRLRLGVAAIHEGSAHYIQVSFDPPDFLVSGKLYDRLTETLRHDAVLRMLANSSGIHKSLRAQFSTWIREASRECFVFRAEKFDEEDTDVFVLRSNWEGVSRVALAIVKVKVRPAGDDDYSVTFIDAPGSLQIAYTDIPGTGDLRDPLVPQYVLQLIHQLRNWLRALRA